MHLFRSHIFVLVASKYIAIFKDIFHLKREKKTNESCILNHLRHIFFVLDWYVHVFFSVNFFPPPIKFFFYQLFFMLRANISNEKAKSLENKNVSL